MSSRPDLDRLERDLKAALDRKTYRRIDFFEPYPKQREFFELGATKRERALIAGNQVGKTFAGADEAALHMTGEYPADWTGRRFDRPTRGWIAGETAVLVRDVQQQKLCGQPGVDTSLGTGMIPREAFADRPTLSRGVSDAFDTIQVRHVSGGISTGTFKSYEQGRQKFQGEPVDWIWLDEEPPMDIYSECLTRTTATNGIVFCTFTPLQGMSDVVLRYLNEPSGDRAWVGMTIDDALHIPADKRAAIIAGYPAHEREARARGVPVLGSGRVFPISEETITEPQITEIPLHWKKIWGLDFGTDHPFAAVLNAWDVESDVWHVLHAIRIPDQFPIHHAAAMKPIGGAVPVAYPHDGNIRDKGSGDTVAKLYKGEGLNMLPEHATWPDGSMSTEAAIMEMEKRMTTGRFKVAAHLAQWFEEFRLYHRENGVLVKKRDDLLSATMKALMMKRYAKSGALGPGGRPKRPASQIADGVDFDVFA